MNQTILKISLLFLFGIQPVPMSTNNTVFNTFKTWNLATLQSIKDQLKQTADPVIKAKWQNRLEVERFTLYSPTADKNGIIDSDKPARYKFLKAIGANKNTKCSIFIVESYTSGEVIVSRNYCIKNSLNSSKVIAYTYYHNEWVKLKDTVVSKIDLKSELIKENVGNNFKGSNITDLILSEIGSSAIKSKYYISFPLKTDSLLYKILEIWGKG
jgi:hypothetical protein